MLEVKGLTASYGAVQVLHGIDLKVAKGEIVAIVGSNGAGKSTLMRAISGLMTRSRRSSSRGLVEFRGVDISTLPASDRLRQGLALVPEGRQVWPELSVRDNLMLGGFSQRKNTQQLDERLAAAIKMFPRLGERLNQEAGTLSGGEQQMLAIGRVLMSEPSLVLFDEPSMGLAPVIVDQILESIDTLRTAGTTIVLVEQMMNLALQIADRGYVLERGHIVVTGSSKELENDERIRAAYLGVAAKPFGDSTGLAN